MIAASPSGSLHVTTPQSTFIAPRHGQPDLSHTLPCRSGHCLATSTPPPPSWLQEDCREIRRRRLARRQLYARLSDRSRSFLDHGLDLEGQSRSLPSLPNLPLPCLGHRGDTTLDLVDPYKTFRCCPLLSGLPSRPTNSSASSTRSVVTRRLHPLPSSFFLYILSWPALLLRPVVARPGGPQGGTAPAPPKGEVVVPVTRPTRPCLPPGSLPPRSS